MKQLYTAFFIFCFLVPVKALAHKRWFLPSDFALSKAEAVAVDFTASNNLFYVDKMMPLAAVKVVSPEGEEIKIFNTLQGKRRSSFDFAAEVKGTYRIVADSPAMYFSSYKLADKDGVQRDRGTLEQLKKRLPEAATDVKFARSLSRIESFVSLDEAATPKDWPVKEGIELDMQTHVNELYSDEPADFTFLLNAKPAKNLKIVFIQEGTRYRDEQEEQVYETDEYGAIKVKWPGPGRYLLEAQTSMPADKKGVDMQFYSYYLSFEVLSP
ncbi:DUF4198 domain-containing protein [Agaribacterium haliotis]|uniref:DUF4198 domain-containing protein n=1 Tax=Agaribacterium haliotis TaxID=2013869 RepID=UPI000BB59354|nr:DUF4198 domain-containing protein [Agaribacterium haliotis]